MSHTSWNLLKRIPRLGRGPIRIIWVEGYVSALEDVVKGLEHQRQCYAGYTHPDVLMTMDQALEHVQAILATAQDTLRGLQAIQKEIPHGE